jgi:hypothetical protein
MSILAKLKNMPTAYWVVGLGGAALGIDYFVEGERSVVSSLYRGVFGGRGEGTAPQRRSLGAARPGVPALVPAMGAPRVYYTAIPPFYPYRHHHPSRFGFRGSHPHPHWGAAWPHHTHYGWER